MSVRPSPSCFAGHFVRAARLAQLAGYDGVELHGAGGYLLDNFVSPRANFRWDDWGGTLQKRRRFPLSVVRRIRAEVGPYFLIVYRLPALQLVERGCTWDEVAALAKALEDAGVDVLLADIGDPDSRVPVDTGAVPRGAYAWVAAKVKAEVAVPVVATARITTPDVAERILSAGDADVVGLDKALFADPEWVAKAAAGAAHRINTCVACDQGCTDAHRPRARASCLVNPRSCRETELRLPLDRVAVPKRVAVVGAGPAGLTVAAHSAERGHSVTLFDAAAEIGGQLRLARCVPGKGEFAETLRYYAHRLAAAGVRLRLNTEVHAELLQSEGYDEVVLCTGTRGSAVASERMLSPARVLAGADMAAKGRTWAVVGSTAEAAHVALFLTELEVGAAAGDDAKTNDSAGARGPTDNIEAFLRRWRVDPTLKSRGGIFVEPHEDRQTDWRIVLINPSEALGPGLGGLYAELEARRVQVLQGARPTGVDAEGLMLQVGDEQYGLKVDHVVACTAHVWAGTAVQEDLQRAGLPVHVLRAGDAADWDAKQAMRAGMALAAQL